MAGHEYTADKDGHITIPYTAQPGTQKVVLVSGPLASLSELRARGRDVQPPRSASTWNARPCSKAARRLSPCDPALTVNGMPAPWRSWRRWLPGRLVRGPRRRGHHQGGGRLQTLPGQESTFEFNVPDRLGHLLYAEGQGEEPLHQRQGRPRRLAPGFALNQIDKTEKVEDLHVTHTDAGFVLDLLGRSGEPRTRSRRAVPGIKHREYRQPVQVSLKTDAAGRVTLGELKDIVETVTATGPEGATHTGSHAPETGGSYPAEICGKAGGAEP